MDPGHHNSRISNKYYSSVRHLSFKIMSNISRKSFIYSKHTNRHYQHTTSCTFTRSQGKVVACSGGSPITAEVLADHHKHTNTLCVLVQGFTYDHHQILILRPPPVLAIHEHYFSNKFHILKAYESHLKAHDFLRAYAQSVKVLLCSRARPITADIIRELPALELVVSEATGVNHIDMAECRRRGISVTNVGDVFSDDVADAAVGLFIDVMRRITADDRFVRRGSWPVSGEYSLGFKLGGKKVGIVVFGNIGLRVAIRLDAMGCIVSYTSRQQKHSTKFTFYPNVLHLASDCDALIVCCALTNATSHMINNTVMRALGKQGVIVNVARGAIIDEVELVKCLVEGEIGGAGLDVFENEPNVPKELPHRTAFTTECFHDAAQVLMSNLEAFFTNKPLLTPVSSEF